MVRAQSFSARGPSGCRSNAPTSHIAPPGCDSIAVLLLLERDRSHCVRLGLVDVEDELNRFSVEVLEQQVLVVR